LEKIAAINISIVLYKTDPHQLIKAISSILNESIAVKILYIIDNSPTDKLRKYCAHKSIIYIHTGVNLGYGSGHNIALARSIEENVDYHLVMNPDIFFQKGTLSSIADFMDSNPDIGQVMPTVLYPDGEMQHLCKLLPTPSDLIIRRFSPFKKWKEAKNHLYEMRFTGYKKQMDVPSLSGCFMFLRVETLKKAGLFDRRFFMYLEDLDLTRRVAEAGRTVYWPGVHIFHEYGKGSYKSPRMLFYHIFSAFAYFNKWGWFADNKRIMINNQTLSALKPYIIHDVTNEGSLVEVFDLMDSQLQQVIQEEAV